MHIVQQAPPTLADVSGRDDATTSLEIFRLLTSRYPAPDFAIRCWNGTSWTPHPTGTPRFTVVLHHPGALRRMFLNRSQLKLGEAYLAGDFSIEDDFESSFRLADYLTSLRLTLTERMAITRRLLTLPRTTAAHAEWLPIRTRGWLHSPARDRQSVTYHYDTSNEFFATWLDSAMVYSCAYFADEAEDLDTAQRRKLEYICRKLRLQPGERFLDIGCGWGGLVLRAAEHYGVRALGITLSEPQARLARDRVQAAQLTDRCRVEVCDYRDLHAQEPFDKIASVGMVEHVGSARLRAFFDAAWRLLRPGGVFLLHGIAESPESKARAGQVFGDRYVFPDSELPAIGRLLDSAEARGFEVRDVESLREHYLFTLRRWRDRLERAQSAAVRAAGSAAYELWRLFLAGAAYRFRVGHYNLYQTLLVKPRDGSSDLPLTRADWYAAR